MFILNLCLCDDLLGHIAFEDKVVVTPRVVIELAPKNLMRYHETLVYAEEYHESIENSRFVRHHFQGVLNRQLQVLLNIEFLEIIDKVTGHESATDYCKNHTHV